jgi:catechol 2,3-dioxygenase-like lactoylglutathione lyase family enzyme
VDYKLEAVVVPVTDMDRSRHFYRALGFRLDDDRAAPDGSRFVQLTPPGSSCSIIFGTGRTSGRPARTLGTLIVADLEEALADLQARGAAPSQITRCPDGSAYASVRDPDGNKWLLTSG